MADRISILVVEDEAMIRWDIVDQLSKEGFQVFQAANADEAIALLTDVPSIRVMFTDIDMPGSMDGIKLSAAVRNRWPPVKIIVTSGHRKIDLTELPSGSVFFSKPYLHTAVVSSMREMLAAH